MARMAAMVAQVDAAIGGRRARAPPARAARRGPAADGRGRCDRGARSSRPAARRRRPARAGSPRRTSPPPARSSDGWRATTTRRSGREVADAWASARRAVRGRPRPLAPGRGDPRRAGPAAPAGPTPASRCSRRSSRRCDLGARARCCATSRELAGRARIDLPDEVDAMLLEHGRHRDRSRSTRRPTATGRCRQRPLGAGPGDRRRSGPGVARGDTFGLSGREREVLALRGPGPDEPRDRRAAVHQPEDGRRPRREHPGQAGGVRPGRGRRRGDPPRPHRPPRSRGLRAVHARTPRDPEGGSPGLDRVASRLARMGSGQAASEACEVSGSLPLEAGGEATARSPTSGPTVTASRQARCGVVLDHRVGSDHG